MLEFAKYLKENFKEDNSSVEKIIQKKWDKVVTIIKEAFDDKFSDKKTALYRIQNEFVNKNIAPPSIDIEFLKNNMNYVIDKVNSLNEGEIRIIINNEVQKGGAGIAGIETEAKKIKKGKKVVEEETDEVESTEEQPTDEEPATINDEDEKIVKVTVSDNKVTVEPSENTGLEKSEHDFENEEEVNSFVDSLENLFKGFKVEKEDGEGEESGKGDDSGEEEAGEGEEEVVNPTSFAKMATESTKKSKGKIIKEDGEIDFTGTADPETAGKLFGGEEPEDSGDEPEDSGDEPEDSGDEPEDSGDEPEDSEAINWEDIADFDSDKGSEEEVPVRRVGSMEFDIEGLDLKKLINNLVNVDGKWLKVTSVTEDKKIVGVNKEGTESEFTFNQIDEMECDINDMGAAEEECPCRQEIEPESGAAEEETSIGGLDSVLTPEQMEVVKMWIAEPAEDLPEDIYNALTDYYADEMPYGTAKASTGDPIDWLRQKVTEELGGNEEEMDEPKVGPTAEEEVAETEEDDQQSEGKILKDYLNGKEKYTAYPGGREKPIGPFNTKEEARKALQKKYKETKEEYLKKVEKLKSKEESFTFAHFANRYLDEDSLTAPSMAQTQGGGLTSKPGVINQKIDGIKPAPKAPVVKGPTAALTANPSKPGETLEKVPAAPSTQVKKGPSTALTSKPKAPPKKIEKVKAAPKMASKAEPKGNFTAKPGKTGQKMEKISAPSIPSEYSKGGFKG